MRSKIEANEYKDYILGKKAGEFYTPHEVSMLMSEIVSWHLAGRKNITIYNKIIYNYPLERFRASGYMKDFQNFATDTNLWGRTLIAWTGYTKLDRIYKVFLLNDCSFSHGCLVIKSAVDAMVIPPVDIILSFKG